MRRPNGFTVLEVLVAILVWAIGLLGFGVETAALTRQISRARRAALVSGIANARLERLQVGACSGRVDGSETIAQGSVTIATLRWTWSESRPGTYQVRLATAPASGVAGAAVTADTVRAVIACDR
jgi:prepilin-type N-terminal cleavage/methylation domain-containing protein